MQIEIQRPRIVEDARGIVCEPVTEAELSLQRNVHIVLTRPGGVRGNHYHEHGTEIMTVQGPALVRVRVAEGIRDIHVPDRVLQRFTLPPRVSHAILNTGSAPGLVVSFNTQPHDPAQPDVHRDVLIDPGGGA